MLWGKKKEATVVAETLGAKNISEPNNKEEETLTRGPQNVCMLNGREEETETNASMP